MNNNLVVTIRRLLGFLMGAVLLAFGVHSQSLIIEPQTTTLLANALNNLTFTVKLCGVNQTPEEQICTLIYMHQMGN